MRALPSDRLHSADRVVYVVRNNEKCAGSPQEIELVVSQKIFRRFGSRFEDCLGKVSIESTLLSKMPQGIPLFLRCQEKLTIRLLKAIEIEMLEPPSIKEEDVREVVQNLYHKTREDFPFGVPEGNASLLWEGMPPRFAGHYLRFSVLRAHVDEGTLGKCSWPRTEQPAIAVFPGGGVGLLEPGHIIAGIPALLLRPTGEWSWGLYSLCAWLKSSFLIWYCSVHLGDEDLFLHRQRHVPPIPVPRSEHEELYQRLNTLAHNIILDEHKFMKEINRDRKRGGLDAAEEEKRKNRHNEAATRQCLTIDKDIHTFLGLSNEEAAHIADTLQAMRMTDFGLRPELDKEENS